MLFLYEESSGAFFFYICWTSIPREKKSKVEFLLEKMMKKISNEKIEFYAK